MPNFKIYTVDNAPHTNGTVSGRPFISFTVKGSFHISARASQILKVKEGSKVVFMQDTQYPSDWYIRAAKQDENGFVLEAHGVANRQVMGFRSSTLADTIATSTFKSQFSRVRFYATLYQPGVLQLNVKQPKVTPPSAFNHYNGKQE